MRDPDDDAADRYQRRGRLIITLQSVLLIPTPQVGPSEEARDSARRRSSTMAMEGDVYAFLLSLVLVACLLYWARDDSDQRRNKTKAALKSGLQRKRAGRRADTSA